MRFKGLKWTLSLAHQTYKWSRCRQGTSLWQSIVAPASAATSPMTNSHSEALSCSAPATIRCTTAQSIMHVMSPPAAAAAPTPSPTPACCLEISSLVPCIGFASPLLMLPLTPLLPPPSFPCCCCWNSKNMCAMCESLCWCAWAVACRLVEQTA